MKSRRHFAARNLAVFHCQYNSPLEKFLGLVMVFSHISARTTLYA